MQKPTKGSEKPKLISINHGMVIFIIFYEIIDSKFFAAIACFHFET